MTIGEWLATRTPAPPPALMSRVRDILGDATSDDARFATDRCLDAAERMVAGLLHDGRTGRESAADLLAADALVTYAFEAASADPAGLVERARATMVRLARLGALEVGASPDAVRGSALPS
jgi:uncharacterized membrane protein